MDTKRLVKTFIELVQIDSESGNEGKIHEYLKNKFMKLGLEIVEDNSKEDTGLGSNNLIVRLHGKDRNKLPLFFSCHTDTVSPGKGIEVIEESGILSSKRVCFFSRRRNWINWCISLRYAADQRQKWICFRQRRRGRSCDYSQSDIIYV